MPDSPFKIQLSFRAVVERLEQLAADPAAEGHARAIGLLEELSSFPQFAEGITDESQVVEHADLIRRLLVDYFPPLLTLNEIKAVNLPYNNIIFNHTQRFQNILKAAGPGFDIAIRDFDEHQFYVLSCCLILNEFYGTTLDFSRPLFYDIPTADGIIRHYKILYNADNLDILPTDKALPVTPEDIELLMNSYENLDLWKQKFPPETWILRGFSIMTLIDSTVENAVSIFKEKLLTTNSADFQASIFSIFRSIFRVPDMKVGFILFNEEEEKFVRDAFGHQMQSFILEDEEQGRARDLLCTESYRCLIRDEKYFAVADLNLFFKHHPVSPLGKRFMEQDIKSFILAPVVKNEKLLGILELVSPRVRDLNSINANKLEVVMPFLTDTVERMIAELQNQVQAVIQERYTTIHESVYWKFKSEAQKLIYSEQQGKEYHPGEIVFPGVYPLYGQIDIKGSSEARNLSVQKDLQRQLEELLLLLRKINPYQPFEAEMDFITAHLEELAVSIKAGTEQFINNYLESRVHYKLRHIKDVSLKPAINVYFQDTEKETGAFHIYRRKYEKTIQLINDKVAGILDGRQLVAQTLYPHYYERFKTDGVEHNLYVGPSIAPSQPFSMKRLYELRLWQLQALCEMEMAHYELKPKLPYPLDVTTLILVYQSAIAIRFRMDEKRFDVDGSYNARFEIVKKRIDKAYIRNTNERITKEGKLTIVYSSDEEAEEYLGYITLLQSQGLLQDDVEQFDIEDLQGVSGLKGMRVGIHHKRTAHGQQAGAES
ncbi:MAG: GAF domain-containing protein [Citrobacter freundii]|nr:MAG: GAF domain-containing protein [Citrobacter freundii]